MKTCYTCVIAIAISIAFPLAPAASVARLHRTVPAKDELSAIG